MDDQVRVGQLVVSAGDRRRRIRVELHKLVVDRLGIFDLSMLPQDEVDQLLAKANVNVDRQIADEEASVVAEFGSDDAPINAESASAHLRAERLLAQVGVKRPTERQYELALVAARYGQTTTSADPVLEDRLEGAEALSDLAKFRLHERGLREGDDNYEAEFLAEFGQAEKEHGLNYYDNAA
jgi:hypothetical protein